MIGSGVALNVKATACGHCISCNASWIGIRSCDNHVRSERPCGRRANNRCTRSGGDGRRSHCRRPRGDRLRYRRSRYARVMQQASCARYRAVNQVTRRWNRGEPLDRVGRRCSGGENIVSIRCGVCQCQRPGHAVIGAKSRSCCEGWGRSSENLSCRTGDGQGSSCRNRSASKRSRCCYAGYRT